MTEVKYTPEQPNVREQDLAGKVAVITGATRGIGRAIALDLACRGCSILGTYTSKESAHLFDTLEHRVKDLYTSAGVTAPQLVGLAANLLDTNCAEVIVSGLKDFFDSKVNIVVHNAAIYNVSSLGQYEATAISAMLLAHVQSPMLIMDAIIREKMLQPRSRIINISTIAVRLPKTLPGSGLYIASKAAVEALTRAWADELGRAEATLDTTVNTVCVGMTNTTVTRTLPAEVRQQMEDVWLPLTSVAPRIGEPEDIADIVGFLASEKARWISGSVIEACGGAAKIL